MRIVGIMSGTSVDAVDVAICDLLPDAEVEGGLAMRLLGYREEAFPDNLRRQVLDLLRAEAAPLDQLTELNFELGQVFGESVLRVIAELGLHAEDLDLIASHGQTIYHLVQPGRRRSTLQMGEPAVIAGMTGVTVAADFRVADVAAGGEGAPLVPYFDALFFHDGTRNRAIQNIGGMANVTFVPAEGEAHAFDTGPGNALIDYGARVLSAGAQKYDRDGIMAAAGRVDEAMLEEVIAHPYFSRRPPKSTGRELFGDAFAAGLLARARERRLSTEDTMATLTAITAESIARAYRAFGPACIDEVVIAGGGARNPTLIRQIEQRLGGPRMVRHEELGIAPDAKEATAFALLGHETLHGRPANLPRCTGASRSAILGKIIPGDNYRDLMGRVFGEEGQPCGPIRSLRLLP